MKYLVTAIRDCEESNGVEIAGIFDTEQRAYEAKARVSEWMEKEGFDNWTVFVSPYEMNRLAWYEIDERI